MSALPPECGARGRSSARCLASAAARQSIEDDRLVAIHEHAIVQVLAYGASQHDLFEVAALALQVFHHVAMRGPYHFLLDERALIGLLWRSAPGTHCLD